MALSVKRNGMKMNAHLLGSNGSLGEVAESLLVCRSSRRSFLQLLSRMLGQRCVPFGFY